MSIGLLISYHSVFACFHGVVLQDADNDHFHGEESITHPNTVTRTDSKWHVHVWVHHLLLVVFTEPTHKTKHGLTHFFNNTEKSDEIVPIVVLFMAKLLNVIFKLCLTGRLNIFLYLYSFIFYKVLIAWTWLCNINNHITFMQVWYCSMHSNRLYTLVSEHL